MSRRAGTASAGGEQTWLNVTAEVPDAASSPATWQRRGASDGISVTSQGSADASGLPVSRQGIYYVAQRGRSQSEEQTPDSSRPSSKVTAGPACSTCPAGSSNPSPGERTETPPPPSPPPPPPPPLGHVEVHSGFVLVRTDTHYRKRGAVLLPAFSPALGEGIPGRFIHAHTCEYARGSPDVRFPASVDGQTAFAVLPPWNNARNNKMPAAVARACAQMGAKAVVLGLPERKWAFDLWGKMSIVWNSINPFARSFELEDWAVLLSGEAAAVAPVEVPVLLVLPGFAKDVMSSWQDASVQVRSGGTQLRSGWRVRAPALVMELPNDVRYFEDGTESGVLRLSTILDGVLRAETLTEQRLDVVWKEVKVKKWQCYYAEGLSDLTTHSTPANFSLLLLLSLRLMKESRLQHCAQVLEKVLLELLERHVFSYAFVDKVAPFQKRQLQSELKTFLGTLTPSRKLNGKQFSWEGLVAILQLWLACGLENRDDVLQNMCEIPQGSNIALELASFKVGLTKAESHGQSQPLTRDEMDVVLRTFADNVATTSELAELLNWSGFVERPPSAVPVVRRVLHRLAEACDGSTMLRRLAGEVSSRLQWGLSDFAPIAARRVLQFDAAGILDWLASSAYASLKTPSAKQIVPEIRTARRHGGDLTSHLQLLEYMRAHLDMEGVPGMTEIITGLLDSFCSADADACCELVAAWSTPLVAENAEVAVTVMKTALSRKFPRSSPQWSDQKSYFAKAFCQAVSKHELSESLSDVLDNAVAALLPTVNFSDPARSLCPTFGAMRGANATTFWARFALRVAKCTKMPSHFDGVGSLLKTLPGWRASSANPKEHMLYAFLQLLAALETHNQASQGDATISVMANILKPLRKKAEELFSQEMMGSTSYVELLQLQQQSATLDIIEPELFSQRLHHPLWQTVINEHLTKWLAAFNIVQAELPILDSLQRDVSGVPLLVAQLGSEASFRQIEQEAQRESSTTMEARAKAVRGWLQPLGTARHPSKERMFFEHFVVQSRPGAASKSMLFRHFVRKAREEQEAKEFDSVAAFATSLDMVHSYLARFLKVSGATLSFDEIMEIGTVLAKGGRSTEDELQLLFAFFRPKGQLDSTVTQQLKTMTQLCGLRDPLTLLMLETRAPGGEKLPGTLQRFEFKCAQSTDSTCAASVGDADYAALKELAASLYDSETTRTWDEAECQRRLDDAHRLLQPSTRDYNSLLGMLGLFQHLASSTKVWEFVHSHKETYVEPEGGYTSAFNDKTEDLLEQLGGEDYRMIDNFKPVAYWVSILVANQGKPFAGLMRSLWDSKLVEQATQPLSEMPFSQLSAADHHMDVVTELFRGGLSGLDSVLPQFESVDKCCIYIFNLEASLLMLAYVDERRKGWSMMDSEKMLDFEQRVGFVRREEKAQQLQTNMQIVPYLEKMQEYRRALALMGELHALGHPDFMMPPCTVTHGKIPRQLRTSIPDEAARGSPKCKNQVVPAALGESRDSWKAHMSEILEKNKLLCLFSSLSAQRMAQLIDKHSTYDIALLLSPLFGHADQQCFVQLQQQVAAANRQVQTAAAWPEKSSAFLSAVMREMSLQGYINALDVASALPSSQGEGPIRYTAASSHSVLLRLLLHIFDGHAPLPFEVLWCDKQTTPLMLRAFLERAKHQPHRRFVLLQVDLIPHTLQHMLMRLFLDSRDAQAGQLRTGHNLRFVETGPCALQSASWIKLENADEVCEGIDLKVNLPSCVHGSNVTCFHGPPGSGKTHQMKKQLDALRSHTVVTLSITEAFSMSEAARKLHLTALEAKGKPLALCVHLNLGKFKHTERDQWSALMESVSKLFFGLLVLRSVEDPSSSLVFNVPPGCKLELLVEIPDRDAHLEPPPAEAVLPPSERTARDLRCFADELPVLMALGRFQTPPSLIDVTDDVHLVCKYLRALEDKSIDHLYRPHQPVDLVILMDCTSSMSSWIAQAHAKSIELVQSAQNKFKVELRTAFVAYRDHCDGDRRLDTLDFIPYANIGQLTTFISSRCEARGGGDTPEDVTGGFEAVLKMSWREGSNRLVCHFADAPAHGCEYNDTDDSYPNGCPRGLDPKALLRRLASEVKANYYFIKCGGDCTNKMLGIFRSVYSGYPDRDFHEYQLGSDASRFLTTMVDTVSRTVSERIEQDNGDVSPDTCRRLLRKYMRLEERSSAWNLMKQTHWLKYLRRRVDILRNSGKFNKNRDFPQFGSTTMKIMLDEVEHFLSEDYQVDWHQVNHEQFVYRKDSVILDGKPAVDYKWSVLATNPDAKDAGWQQRQRMLRSLNMQVPTKDDLARPDRRVLDAYLANGLGIELHEEREETSSNGAKFDFPLGTLPIINHRQFVLTLDFVMKLLCMNERIECGVPCIMEGETGVSKTELTRMLFVLKNSVARTPSDLKKSLIAGAAVSTSDMGGQADRQLGALRKLADFWRVGEELQNDEKAWRSADVLALRVALERCAEVAEAVLAELSSDPSLDPLAELEAGERERVLSTCREDAAAAAQLLKWYVTTCIERHPLWSAEQQRSLDWTFFPIDVHAALTPQDIARPKTGLCGVEAVVARAKRLQLLARLLGSDSHRKAKLCLFFDEFNTSSCMGVFKELLMDHSFDGEPLPNNIVIVAAGNPSREKIEFSTDARSDEQGHQWAIGHYQVHPLPASMLQMMWDYGSLKPDLEREFILKRLRFLQSREKLSDTEVNTLASLVHASQQETRDLAKKHIKEQGHIVNAKELDKRANSSVSLRDILRVFKLFSFFNQASGPLADVFLPGVKADGEAAARQRRHRAMLLALAVVYYLRLGSNTNDLDQDFRRKFRTRLKGVCGQQDADVEGGLARAMTALMKQTILEPGIAQTRGLLENVFMVVICVLAQVPLMIVGPPGSSKTLAVTIVAANARGQYSQTEFYKAAPHLIPFHYQCSRRSTSLEIQAVFERAIERQSKADRDKTGKGIRCFVFMDEAGLPEEERESLKVLHYYLEDHMSVAARVGFVAITNHLLDTAKVNRCATLTRTKPDHTELMNVARGCLGSEEQRRQLVSTVPALDRSGRQIVLPIDPSPLDSVQKGLLDRLCEIYDACMSEVPTALTAGSPPTDFVKMFGLRDFMHFIKLLGRLALTDAMNPTISREKIVEALERNMNGVEPDRLRKLLEYFLTPFPVVGDGSAAQVQKRTLRNPLDLMLASLSEQTDDQAAPVSRYKLVIDTTTDDSILRTLQPLLSASTVKLSDFSEDSSVQQINAISAVKWAAEKGEVILLSQTESINESFYDLFNQHFRKYEDKSNEGITVTYHANIAVGSHSRRCKVSPGFQCVVHLALPELQLAPAPFLNRFEKYRLTQADLLESHLRKGQLLSDVPLLGELLKTELLLAHVQDFVLRLGVRSFYGFAPSQTIESALLSLLMRWKTKTDVIKAVSSKVADQTFRAAVEAELSSEQASLESARCVWADPEAVARDMLLQQPNSEPEGKVGLALLAQCVLQELIVQLVQVVIPEHLFKHPASLPAGLLQFYLERQQEHFSLAALLRKIASDAARCHVVYTRTCAAVLALQSNDAATAEKLKEVICEDRPVSVLNFFQFTREPQLVKAIEDFLQPMDPRKVLLVLIDGAQTAMSQVNFTRHKIDELLLQPWTRHRGSSDKSIALVLHVPAADLLVQAVYDTTFCPTWTTSFLDSVEDEGATAWLELGAGLRNDASAFLMSALEAWLPSVLGTIAKNVELPPRMLELPAVLQRARADGTRAVGVLEQRKGLLQLLLEVDLNGSSVKSILLSRYCDLWASEDRSFDLLREQIKKKIAALASGELQMSLVEALTGEVREMFTKALQHLLCAALAELNALVLLQCPQPLQALTSECFRALHMPSMAELTAPLRSVRIAVTTEPPQLSSMVPFFSQLFKVFNVAATQALANKQSGEDEMEETEWWQLKTKRIEEKVRASADSLATVAFQFLAGVTVNAELWGRYLDHFVARLYPCAATAETPLQHEVLRAWLAAKLTEVDPSGSHKVASLHAVAQYEPYESLLATLAACIDPLASLAPADELRQQIVGVIEGAEPADVVAQLNVAMVRAFYQLMLQIGDNDDSGSVPNAIDIDNAPPLWRKFFKEHGVKKQDFANEGKAKAILQALADGMTAREVALMPPLPGVTDRARSRLWAEAFGQAKLHTIPATTRGIDFKQIDAMSVVQVIVLNNVSADSSFTSCIRSVIATVRESSAARLNLADIWCALEQHGAMTADATLCSSLAKRWLRSAPGSEADLRCLLGSVCSSTALTTPQRTPLLETLLLGHQRQKEQEAVKAIGSPSGSLVAWMEVLQEQAGGLRVTELLEQQLNAEAMSCPAFKGQPPWFQERQDDIEDQQDATQPLTKAYFQVVWRWMQLRHARDGLSELAGLAQELQTSRKLVAVPIQRALALSAVRVRLVDQVAARIVEHQEGSLLCDGDEADRFMGQLESMVEADSDIAPSWAGELALAVCTKLTDVARGKQLLETRAANEEQVNRVMATWLQDSLKMLGDDSPINPSAFQERRPPLQLQTLPALLGSQTGRVTTAQKFVRDLVSRRDRLRLLWVIPDLLEFYRFLTNEMSDHPIPESELKTLKLGALLNRLLQLEDGEYWRQLWVRVKVGVNMFLADAQRAFGGSACSTPLHEDLPVWSILSAPAGVTFKMPTDCLYAPLERMLGMLHEFVQTASPQAPMVKPDECERHSETGEHFLDTLTEMDVYKMQEALPPVEGESLAEQAERLTQEVRMRVGHLDAIGPIAKAVASHCSWSADGLQTAPNRHRFDLTAIGAELSGLKSMLRRYALPERYRKVCRFEDSTPQRQEQSTYHSQVYHSLGYDSLRELTSALLPIMEFAEADGQQEGTVRELLMSMYPGAAEDDYLSRAYVNLEEDEQRSDFLGTPVAELPKLYHFLRGQLHSEAFRFAREPLELKRVWSAEVDTALATLAAGYEDLAAEASRLQASLVKYRRLVAAAPEVSMCTSLAKGFTSEAALLKEIPLLRDLKRVVTEVAGFELVGAHYVRLRQQLEEWSKVPAKAAPVVPWAWPFFFSHGATGVPVPDLEDALRAHMTPWFLLESPEFEAARREREDQERMEALKSAPEDRQQSASREVSSPASQPSTADALASPAMEQVPEQGGKGGKGGKGSKGGRAGGRGGGRGARSLGELVQADARNAQQQHDAQETARVRLQLLCRDQRPLPESLVDDLKSELQAAKSAGLANNDAAVERAMEVRDATVREREQTLAALVAAHAARPLDDAALRSVLARAHEAGVPRDGPEIESVTRLLREATKTLEALSDCLADPFPSEAALHQAMQVALELQLTDPRLAHASKLLRQLQAEQMYFESEAKQRWGSEAAAKLKASCISWKASSTSAGWPSGDAARKAAEGVLDSLAYSTDRKSVQAAVRALKKKPLTMWAHANAYLAAANSCSTHLDPYADDAQEYLDDYAGAMAEGADLFVPAFLLAAARLCSNQTAAGKQFRAACLRRCCVHETQALLTTDEQRVAKLAIGALAEPAPDEVSTARGVETLLSRWTQIKSETDAIACPSLDKLLKMVGLQTVKEQALELYKRVKVEQALPAERRVSQSLNFALLGNPGTGKTAVARHLGGMLKELGERNDKFVGTTGEKLARMGADKVSKLIDDTMGGVMFIDEAYGLEPSRNADAAAVAQQLLDVAEEKRTELTIILAGYKDDMVAKLFEFNDGFHSRFNYQITFDDYNEAELAQIFAGMCTDSNWPPAEGEEVVAVAARRLARGRGRRGFGNAREVRKLFQAAYRRALDRDTNAQSLKTIDIIGPPPDREHVPKLGEALDELEKMIGLEKVKEDIGRLVTLAQTNYERELEGQPPYLVPLNRVFLGNPGTGKTTVAKLYGRILNAAGLLSKGECELKQPSDLTGSHVGETQKRTSALVKQSMGKVLVIDEAYALNGSSYGHEAITTLVGLVHGTPGEDIAVVLIGYEKDMKKMFREANEGLTRRFGLKDAFRFDDFDDEALDLAVLSSVKQARLSAPKEVRAKVIKALAAQRARPIFGNAGDAVYMVARAKERLSSRDPRATVLTLADFGLDRADGDGSSALEGLFKVEHIIKDLQELKNTLERCDDEGKDRAEFLESYVFLGSPGTGKTTIARAMAQILHEVGVLGSNHVKVVSGLDMQGSFVGQTKDKVNEMMAEAQGGVLFVDEAYTLGQGLYSSEAIDQLVALMTSPDHLNKTVVILAGYQEPMERMLGSNEGLRSRVTGRIKFPDWDADDCVEAVRQKCEREDIRLTDAAAQLLADELREIHSRPSWANARDSVTTCRLLYKARAQRCASTAEAEPSYVEQDVTAAMAKLRETRPQGSPISVAAAAEAAIKGAQAAAAAAAAAASAVRPSPQLGNFVGGALLSSPAPTVACRESEAESELEVSEATDEVEAQQVASKPDSDSVYAALQQACVDEGYDTSHERRQELVSILEAVEAAGEDFPANIMSRVVDKTGLTEGKAHEMLKPQVHRVLGAVREAVQEEELRREDERRLQEEARLEELRRKQEEYRRLQEALQRCRACPQGFAWHRSSGGWRCNGGSHFMTDEQLRSWNA